MLAGCPHLGQNMPTSEIWNLQFMKNIEGHPFSIPGVHILGIEDARLGVKPIVAARGACAQITQASSRPSARVARTAIRLA